MRCSTLAERVVKAGDPFSGVLNARGASREVTGCGDDDGLSHSPLRLPSFSRGLPVPLINGVEWYCGGDVDGETASSRPLSGTTSFSSYIIMPWPSNGLQMRLAAKVADVEMTSLSESVHHLSDILAAVLEWLCSASGDRIRRPVNR